MYGPSSMLVYSTGDGVYGFTYDPSIGEFILTHENMRCPPISKCYSINEAYSYYWVRGMFRIYHDGHNKVICISLN